MHAPPPPGGPRGPLSAPASPRVLWLVAVPAWAGVPFWGLSLASGLGWGVWCGRRFYHEDPLGLVPEAGPVASGVVQSE